MPIDINYDEAGTPKSVLLAYAEYQHLVAKPEERALISQTAGKICELIQQFARDADTDSSDTEISSVGDLPAEDFTPSEQSITEAQKPAPADMRQYKNATGYYDRPGFRVLKGSKATGYTSNTFKSTINLRPPSASEII